MATNNSALMIVTMITMVVVIVHSFIKEDGGTMLVAVLISMIHTHYPQPLEWIQDMLGLYGVMVVTKTSVVWR